MCFQPSAGATEVPLPLRGVDIRVAHPVPLAVQDVVADLHVLGIFATESIPVPATQANGLTENEQHAAAAEPRVRWALMTFLMYAASAAPRLAR